MIAVRPPRGGRRLAALAVGAVLLVAGCSSSSGPKADPTQAASPIPVSVKEETAPITVKGTALPELPDSGKDPALGKRAPVVSGTGFTGKRLTIGRSGRAYVVLFVAHWCPHCQREVPLLSPWLAGGHLPKDVDWFTVATATREDYPNYPPSSWLRKAKWPDDVLADSSKYAAAQAYGLSAFPFFVVVGSNGKVLARFDGETPISKIQTLVDQLGKAPTSVPDAVGGGAASSGT